MLTIRSALEKAVRALDQSDTNSARRDAQLLLSFVLGVERSTLYAYPERTLTEEQERRFLELTERRRLHEPVAYLLGSEEFYGHAFFVDARVLIPRPETEMLVENALKVGRTILKKGIVPVVADIGTGSGIIPITLALEEPRLTSIYATDVSSDALAVAALNCRYHDVEGRVQLLHGDLLAPLPEPVDILIANLPYVGTDEMEELETDVTLYEPHLALFSGPEGLDLLRRLFMEAKQAGKLNKSAILLLEIGYQQREALTTLLHEVWPQADVTFKKDFAGWDRLLQVTV